MADQAEPPTKPNPNPDPGTSANDATAALVAALTAPLTPLAKYKFRSHQTSKTTHLPLLQQHHHQHPPTVVLLGDSMFERMITIDESSNLVEPWPSAAMLPDSELPAGTGRLRGVFNASVGGDRVANIAYRLVGERFPDDPKKDLPGLMETLIRYGGGGDGGGGGGGEGVKVWVVQAGTNDLSAKKGLADRNRDALRVVLRALLGMPARSKTGKESRVLVTGLFYRKDVSRELVDEANAKLADMVRGLNRELGIEKVVFLPAISEVKTEEHLVDHVHLRLDGYRVWMRELFPAVVGLLKEMDGEIA
ncbi:hypothetical protein MFIFM68171_10127 [Madurella fahalii]|uniref:SGNH hydrolase-type esterase domain-containing protein n=1 Tax=Madurella fahalii TaxID=1157608 RepID=A0ABQ0GQ99_9PEZI